MNSACRLPLFSSDDLDLPVAWRDEGGRVGPRSRRRLLAEAVLLAEKMSPHLAPGAESSTYAWIVTILRLASWPVCCSMQ